MNQEIKDYIDQLEKEFYSKPWEKCYKCHTALRHPMYKGLLISFYRIGKKQMFVHYDEKA